jgi:cell division protein FtsB
MVLMETHPLRTPNEQNHFYLRKTMTMSTKRMMQAYREAPWRIATQRGVLFLIVAIMGASTLWVMVNVSIQAASAGLEIQQLQYVREDLEREIAGLRTEFAKQTSSARMEQRAAELGFEPIKPEEITYMVIPGYTGRESVIKAPPPGENIEPPLIKPIYTQSLWEWMLQGVITISEQQQGVIPR